MIYASRKIGTGEFIELKHPPTTTRLQMTLGGSWRRMKEKEKVTPEAISHSHMVLRGPFTSSFHRVTLKTINTDSIDQLTVDSLSR